MPRRLRVLYILPGYFVYPYLREHVLATKLYHQVVVLSAPRVPSSCTKPFVVERALDNGTNIVNVRYRRSPIPHTTIGLYVYALISAFRQILKDGFRPDLIHAHFYSMAVPAFLLGKLFKIPVVVTEHSGEIATVLRGFSRLEAQFGLRRADLLIADSDSLRQLLELHGVRGPFRVIPNAVDTDFFFPSSERSDTRREPKRLVIVARLDPVKGYPVLLNGLALLKETREDFTLDSSYIGVGDRRAEYEAMSRSLGLERHVAFHGYQPRAVMAELVRRSHVFVFSSHSESCPCALIEAMASGLPVVASDIPAVRAIVPDNVGVFFPKGDSAGLAKALSQMLDHVDSYDAREIATYAKTHFGLEAVGRQLDIAYGEIPVRRK